MQREVEMKKTGVFLWTVFFLLCSIHAAQADHGHRYGSHSRGHHQSRYEDRHDHSWHGGHSHKGYSHGRHPGHHDGRYGHRHHDHCCDHIWKAAAVGLGAAVIGSAIMNRYDCQPVTVIERRTYYYQPAPPPPPCRVWVPGHYVYQPGGYYIYVPGCYQ